MSDVEVRIDRGALDALLKGRDGPVASHLLRSAIQVEGAAKRGAPVDTGRLRSSITHELGRDGQGLFALVGTNVEYARYVEFGTSRMAPQPFLRPAIRAAS